MSIGLRKLITKYELIMAKDKGVIKVSFSNQVTKTVRYAADAYSPKEPPCKYGLNTTQDKAVIKVSLWLPLATKLP